MNEGILKRFFPQQRVKQHLPRTLGGLIQCNDCGKTGHIEIHGLQGYTLSGGWVMAWSGGKPIYSCPHCGDRRVDEVFNLLGLDPSLKSMLKHNK